MPTQASEFQAWWAAALASIPIIGLWYKVHMDLRKDILRAYKAAADCHKEFERIQLIVANQALDNARTFATKTHLESITTDLKQDAKEREMRLTKRLDAIFVKLDTL